MREPTPDEQSFSPIHSQCFIDIACDELIPIREVPKRLPKKPCGKRIHISAVYRWMQKGVRGVKLDFVFIGGTRYTSVEALQRFVDRLSMNDRGIPRESTPRRRQMEIDTAAREAKRILDRRQRH